VVDEEGRLLLLLLLLLLNMRLAALPAAALHRAVY
jgi:hypothetical protein